MPKFIRVIPVPDAVTEQGFALQARRIWKKVHHKAVSSDDLVSIYLPSSVTGDKGSRSNFEIIPLARPKAFRVLPGYGLDSTDYRPENGWVLIIEYASTWTKHMTVQLAHIVLFRGVSTNEAEKAARKAVEYLVKASGGEKSKGKRPGLTVPQREVLDRLFKEESANVSNSLPRGAVIQVCRVVMKRLQEEGIELSLPTIKREFEPWREKHGYRTRLYTTKKRDLRS